MLLITEKYLTGEELPYKARENFDEEKSTNFTIAENRKTFWDTLKFISFVYLFSLVALMSAGLITSDYTFKFSTYAHQSNT